MGALKILFILSSGYLAAANVIPSFTPSDSTFNLMPLRNDLPQTHLGELPLPGKCECIKNACGCCARYDIKQLNFNHTGCLNFTYIPDDFAIQLNLLLSNSSIFNARISGRNPPALCIPIPQLPILSICVKMYDVHTDDQYLYACLNMELQFNGVTLVVISFDCAKFSQTGISFFKPTPAPPSDNGQWDLNFSLAGLEQAIKGNNATAPNNFPSLFNFDLSPQLSNETVIRIVEAVNEIVKNETNAVGAN